MRRQRGLLLLIAALSTAVAPALVIPRRTTAPWRRPKASRGAAAANEFSGAELDAFEAWLHSGGHGCAVATAGDNVDTAFEFSGVVWRLLADLSLSPEPAELLVHFPGMASQGGEPLRMFSDMMEALVADAAVVSAVDELSRLTVTLPDVIGPGLKIVAQRRTPEHDALVFERAALARQIDEHYTEASLRHFVQRMVVGNKACPFTSSTDVAATGLQARGVEPGPVAYRFSPTIDALDAVAETWLGFAEVLNAPPEDLSTTLLSLPVVAHPDLGSERFRAVCEVITRSLLAYGADELLGLVYFHPLYDRDTVAPPHDAAYGHLPPLTWLPAMMEKTGASKEHVAWFVQDAKARQCSNFQRRAPCMMINILRATQLQAATGGNAVERLDVFDDPVKTKSPRTVEASGLLTYSRNALKLAQQGEAELISQLAEEMNMCFG